MDELPTRARALLEAARGADDPTPRERERTDWVVRAGLAAHGVHLPLPHATRTPGPDLSATSSSTSSAAVSGSTVALTSRVLVAAVVLGGGAWVALGKLSGGEPAPAPRYASSAAATPHARPVAPALPAADVVTLTEAVGAEPPRVAPSARRAGEHRPLHESQLDRELELIAEADLHLRGARFDAALRTLARHARRFPRGALREERAALRVLALCGGEPGPDARTQRARFLGANPSSVLTARVSAACGVDGAPAR